jgi:hypothetical protein
MHVEIGSEQSLDSYPTVTCAPLSADLSEVLELIDQWSSK